MKIIQSFWTKPFEQSYKGDRDNRPNGGWLNQSYYFMSWVYSFWQLSKFYSDIELVTDKRGKELLVDLLELPYTKVHVVLDSLDGYSPELWALGKVYAYGMMDEPFLHVDSDFFIWSKFPEELMSKPLVAQHKEFGYAFYQRLYKDIRKNFHFMPDHIVSYARTFKRINAYNMGVAGGTDYLFFKNFSSEVFDFVNTNMEHISKIQAGLFNTFFEQVFYCSRAYEKKLDVYTLLKSEDETVTTWQAQGLDRFVRAPKDTFFIHLYGYCKRNERYCLLLESRLRKDYPSKHQLVKKIFDEHLVDISPSSTVLA